MPLVEPSMKVPEQSVCEPLSRIPTDCYVTVEAGRVLIPTVRKNCIVIPQTATYELQNRVFVYKVVEGKAKSAPVEVFKLNNGTEYIVESGLNSGDVIIAEGAGLVREGTIIESQTTQE